MVNSFFQCVQRARREQLGLCDVTLNCHLGCVVAERVDAFCCGRVHEFFVFGLTGHFHGDESGDDTLLHRYAGIAKALLFIVEFL
jgi:hypothetical protein